MHSFAVVLTCPTNAVSVYLMNLFNPETKQSLSDFLSGSNDAKTEANLKEMIAVELNDIIASGKWIYDANRFKNARLSAQLRQDCDGLVSQLAGDTNLVATPEYVVQLNRELLEGAFPVELLREHVKVVPQLLENPYMHDFNLAQFVFSGGFTRYDERLNTQDRRLDASLYYDFAGSSATPMSLSSDLGIEFENEMTGLGLTLTAAGGSGALIIPGCVVDASGIVAKAKRQQNVSLFFFGNGANYSGQATRANGIHEVCIRMVNRATLALLGKVFKLPYWKCLRNGQPDNTVIELMSRDFQGGFGAEPSQRRKQQLLAMVQLLKLNGYTNLVSSAGLVRPNDVDQALQDYCRKQHLEFNLSKDAAADDMQNARAYVQLIQTAPIPGFPTLEQEAVNAKAPEAGVLVEFNGFPASYRDILYRLVANSPDVREVSEQTVAAGEPDHLAFKADMYLDDAQRLAQQIKKNWPDAKLDPRENCDVEVINHSYVRVYYKTGNVRRVVHTK